jgi:cobalt-zinc-cadmium efflux system protein
VGLNLLITGTEVAGGLVSGSLALLSDALHNASDVAALLIALAARVLGRRPPSVRFSYGHKRLEVMAALANASVLVILAVVVGYAAIGRLRHPQPLDGGTMLAVAVVACAANMAAVFLLKGHEKSDLNVRSAFLHLIQDAAASFVVVIAALLADTRFGPYIDPAVSLLIGLAVVVSAVRLIWESLAILGEGTPTTVDLTALASSLDQAFAPARFHHLHVWSVGPGQVALTAHVKLSNGSLGEVERRLAAIRAFLADRWEIRHSTLEPEWEGCSEDGTLGQWR